MLRPGTSQMTPRFAVNAVDAYFKHRPKVARDLRAYALWFANKIGLECTTDWHFAYPPTWRNSAPWPQQTAYLGGGVQAISQELRADNLLHEVHHYLVADTKQRATPGYGLIDEDDEQEVCSLDLAVLSHFSTRLARYVRWEMLADGERMVPTVQTRSQIADLVAEWRLTNQT